MALPAERERFDWTAGCLACVFAAFCPGMVLGCAFYAWAIFSGISSGYSFAEIVSVAFRTFLFPVVVVSGLCLIFVLPISVPAMWLLARMHRLSIAWLFLAALAVAGAGCAIILGVTADDAGDQPGPGLLPGIVWGGAACVLPSAGLAGLVAFRSYHWLRSRTPERRSLVS